MLTKVEDRFLTKYFDIQSHLHEVYENINDGYKKHPTAYHDHPILKLGPEKLNQLALECAKASVHAESIGYLQTAVENALREVFDV